MRPRERENAMKHEGFTRQGSLSVLAALFVLARLLSSGDLYRRIRVQGGAYGGFAVMDDSGLLAFASYRDPNLLGTLQTYDPFSREQIAAAHGLASCRQAGNPHHHVRVGAADYGDNWRQLIRSWADERTAHP